MIFSSIAIVYFSATNITHTYATTISKELVNHGCEVRLINVTTPIARIKSVRVEDYDYFIFGFPVFGDFAPRVINDWLPTLRGEGKRCTMFFTYGGRTCGYAHFHTKQLLEKSGFKVLFSAEFLGRHSFNLGGWSVLPDRPDQQDFSLAQDYANLALERFLAPEPKALRLQKPFKYPLAIKALESKIKKTKRGLAQPIRMIDDCCMCRDCEMQCPTEAFNADTGLSDIDLCIECMRCVFICPDKVIKCDPGMKDHYQDFLDYCHLTEAMLNEKKGKIITEFWQAAC